jgi:hypothetical protein
VNLQNARCNDKNKNKLEGNSNECHLIRDREHLTNNAYGFGGRWDIIECNTTNTLKINKIAAAL